MFSTIKKATRYGWLVTKLVAWKAVEEVGCMVSAEVRRLNKLAVPEPVVPILAELDALHVELFGGDE